MHVILFKFVFCEVFVCLFLSILLFIQIVEVSTRLPAVQRLIEIKIIAEQLHFKISTLLLHSGKVTEAVIWFLQHKNAYKKLIGVPEVIFLHWEWMSRQYLVFGELLETSAKNSQSLTQRLLILVCEYNK